MTKLAITGIAVFDPERHALVQDQTVVIHDSLISQIGPRERGAPDDAEIIDGRGLTALPGLIDCHTHLCYDGKASRFTTPTEAPGILSALAMQACEKHLAAGVTTVRDCGAPDGIVIQLREAIAQGIINGPRILAAGRMLTMTGGHGSQIGRLVDGPDSGTHGARAEIAEGADFIKVMATGGVVTKGVSPEQTALQPEELAAIVRAAHDAGRKVTAHATGLVGARNAILAGVDSIEHGRHLDDETVALAVERGTVLIATLSARHAQHQHAGDLPDWMRQKVLGTEEPYTASFRRAAEGGVKLAAGTDGGTPDNPHGGLAQELALMVSLGVSPADALMAATLGAAQALGIDDITGTLSVGKSADLLIVGGDPLADLACLSRPVAVFVRGRRIPLERDIQGFGRS